MLNAPRNALGLSLKVYDFATGYRNGSVAGMLMSESEMSGIDCLASHETIFQLYVWRHIDVQADWRRRS